MRPLKLKIAGFGTYCKPTVVELDKFGKSGLYLITGDTGSGKTTIFDAITYALYGEPNGENRKASMMRSNLAGLDDPTEVELTFEYQKQVYVVKRNPGYERRAKRGEGTTMEDPDALLTMPDGRTVSGPSKVTAKITEILGIGRKEFTQIEMIAQGDFRELLFADTNKRQEIFRKIFKTHFYQVLQDRLSKEERELRIQTEKQNSIISIRMGDAGCEPGFELEEKVKLAKAGGLTVEEKISLLNKIITSDEVLAEKIQKEKSEKIEELNSVNADLSRGEDFRKATDQLGKSKKELEVATEEVAKASENYNVQLSKEEERKNLASEKSVLEKDISLYDNLENKRKIHMELVTELNKQKTNLEKLEDERDKNKEQIEKVEGELKEFADSSADKISLEAEKEKLEAKDKNLIKLEKSLGDLKEKSLELEQLQEKTKKFLLENERISKEFSEKNTAFLCEQAGIMAETLQSGMPCPVCGSTEHPVLAHKSENAPTQSELDSLKKEVEAWNKKTSDAVEKTAGAKAEKESVEKNYISLLQEILELEAESLSYEDADFKIKEEKSKVEKSIKEISSRIIEIEKAIKRRSELEKILPGLRETDENYDKEISSLTASVNEKRGIANESLNSIKELKGSLKFESKMEASNHLVDLGKKVSAMEKALESSRVVKENAERNVASLKERIRTIEEQLSGMEKVEIESLVEKKRILEEERNGLDNHEKQLFHRQTLNNGILEQIKECAKEIAELEKKHTWVLSLAKTANGSLGDGKQKIELETFIQMTYFDRIIQRANVRLGIMTDGNFELVRSTEGEDGRSQTGLDLDVIDYTKRNRRSVKTLSGGESFMASLSLALGLADEIQSSVGGGLQLDSMFVDEGFGSLDETSLRQAIMALTDLTKGNRIIGIISHVAELSELLDNKLVVSKDKLTGESSVEIITE